MQNLTIIPVQFDMNWENSVENILYLDGLVPEKRAEGEVVVLPEMFNTGFTMRPEKFAETMDGEAVRWMKKKSMGRAVCGSISIEENGNYYNRFLWVENGDVKAIYDKRHLFSFGNEGKFYKPGNSRTVIEYAGWKIQPFICYDLRFPVWCRNDVEADLQIYVANWPQVRIFAWEKLLQARAIENQCYVVGVNRIGEDGNGNYHNGSSMVCDFSGESLFHKKNEEFAGSIALDQEMLRKVRMQFPVLKDADGFEIK